MITVAKLIEELQKYPPDACCYAYEGERTGPLVVVMRSDWEETKFYTPLGEIKT